MPTLLLATRNLGKVREFSQLLAPLGYDVITAAQAGFDEEPAETGDTFHANAEIKAKAVFIGTGGGHPVLSDDSGLAVDALGGAPGVWSARYAGREGAGADAANNARLLRELHEVTDPAERTARYQIALCFIEPGHAPVHFEGTCLGRIAFAEKGSGGFGYDTLFVPVDAGGDPLDGRTFAEMSAAEKHPLSHRGKAVKAFLAWLKERA
jgi:XTP/dITP diphosphohydrolase